MPPRPVDGLGPLHVQTAGHGEVDVVLVHGLGHRLQVWDAVASDLVARGYRVHRVDLPGHGRSSATPGRWRLGLGATVHRLDRTLDELGVALPVLVGNSLGGLVCLQVAAARPTAAVVALAPAGYSPRRRLLLAGVVLTRRRLRVAAARAARRRRGEPQRARRRHTPLHSWHGYLSHLAPGLLSRGPATPAAPTTFVWGDRDVVLPLGQMRLPEREAAPLHVLADCGHYPMLDQPRALSDLVDRIAREHAGGPTDLPPARRPTAPRR